MRRVLREALTLGIPQTTAYSFAILGFVPGFLTRFGHEIRRRAFMFDKIEAHSFLCERRKDFGFRSISALTPINFGGLMRSIKKLATRQLCVPCLLPRYYEVENHE